MGPDGEVTVTDIEPKWAADRQHPPNVRLSVHDITRDPLPGSTYDVVHARLVLIHLPERLAVLDRLVRALKPVGWLVLEDFDCRWKPVFAAPDEGSVALFERVHDAPLSLLEKAGAEPLWGRQAVGAMGGGLGIRVSLWVGWWGSGALWRRAVALPRPPWQGGAVRFRDVPAFPQRVRRITEGGGEYSLRSS